MTNRGKCCGSWIKAYWVSSPREPSNVKATTKYTTPSFKSGKGRSSLIMMGTKCARMRCLK